MSDQEIIRQLVMEIESIKTEQRRQAVQNKLYQVLNHSATIDVTADQNNFALDDYDTVFLNPTAARNIRGITGGVGGRLLFIRNQGSFNLTFTNQDAAATAENRIATVSGAAVIVATRETTIFQYVSSTARWFMIFPIA